MKLKSLALGGALMAMLALGVVGCNENPVDDLVIPSAPSNVQAVSLTGTSVGLKWTASLSAPVTYVVSVDNVAVDTVATTSTTVGNLTAGEHTFMVKTLNSSGTLSSGATVVWAAADRYVDEPGASTVTLKLYEFDAAPPQGSGLGLDGGVRNISTATGEAGDYSGIQLAIFMNNNNTFDIGPAAAFDEYSHVNDFDQNVFVSDTSFDVNSLDEWYGSTSLDNYFPASPSNGSAFTFNNVAPTGVMFIARTGTLNNYHYARVLVKGGTRVKGTAPNRYVEVEVSYQASPNVKYAKFAVGKKYTPAGSVVAHNRR